MDQDRTLGAEDALAALRFLSQASFVQRNFAPPIAFAGMLCAAGLGIAQFDR
jgi:hypothetical protein